jgi:hypothetical protein
MTSPRSSPAEVSSRFTTDLSDADLQTFVDDAHAYVEPRVGSAISDDDLLTRIETYVACHFAAVRDPRFTSQSGASRSASYEDRGSGGEGLRATQHGRRAIDLDPTDSLDEEDDVVFSA